MNRSRRTAVFKGVGQTLQLVLVLSRLFALLFLMFAGHPSIVLANTLAHSARHYPRHHLLVGYFPQWGLYDPQPYYVKALATNGSAAKLSQINFANASVQNGQCSLSDPNADLNTIYTSRNSVNGKADKGSSSFRGYFHQLEELKRRYPKLRILISLEGKAADFVEDASPKSRKAFVASCVDTFLRGHFAPGITKPGIFDGFDVDWESPQTEDAANFRALLEEFRRQMNSVRPGLRLSIAVGQAPQMLPGTDFATLAPLVDQIGIMNYDYAGPWNARTGFLAPLFSNPMASYPAENIERSIASYKAAGVPSEKLLMGLPFYGYSWTEVDSANNGLFQTGNGVHADEPYHFIHSLSAPFSVYRDQRSRAPWLFDGQTFWSYEDTISVRFKVSYAAHQHLGGVMIWELSGDSADGELFQTAYRSLHHPLKASTFARVVAASPPVPRRSIPPPQVPAIDDTVLPVPSAN